MQSYRAMWRRVLDVYEREINRYGGKEVIEACERVFFKDSKLIESFYAINKKMEPSILEEYYIKGIAFILRNSMSLGVGGCQLLSTYF